MKERSPHEHHRAGNGDELHEHRGKGIISRGMVQWVVGAFLTGIISAVAFFAVTDRARIADEAHDAFVLGMENRAEIQVLKAELKRLERIERDQREILTLLKKLD